MLENKVTKISWSRLFVLIIFLVLPTSFFILYAFNMHIYLIILHAYCIHYLNTFLRFSFLDIHSVVFFNS